MLVLHAGRRQNLFRHTYHDLLLVHELLDAADQRDHDFGNHLHALPGHQYHGFENGAGLHLRDLGIGDAQAAAAVAQHGVELVQLFHALQQRGKNRLEVFHFGAKLLIGGGEFLLLLDVGVRQDGEIHHQVFALGKELMQRRIERADHHREAVHGLEEAGEILALHGQQLLQGFAAALFVARQNHGLHVLDAAFGEEHVLRAAEADAFGAEAAGGLGVARNIGIGAHAEAAAKFVGPTHEAGQNAGRGVGIQRVGLPGKSFAGGTVEREPVAFFQSHGLAVDADADFLLVFVHRDGFGAGHAGRAHAAADHRRVAGHAAARGENSLGHFHAVDIVGHGFLAHQDHRRAFELLDGVVGGEDDGAHRRARRGRQPLGEQRQRFLGFRIEHRMQELVELLGIDTQHGFLLVDEAFAHHLDGDADRRGAGALAVARLQHVEFAILDGELEILDVAVVLFEHRGDFAKLVVDRFIPRFELRDGMRGADAGDDVFALGVLQELAVEGLFAGGRIAREADAGGGRFPEVAEDHGLHVDGGAQVVGDLVHLAIVDGAVGEPGAKHGVARALKLFHGILREWLAGFLLHQGLVAGDHLLQVRGGQFGIELGLGFLLLALEDGVEIVLADFQHHVAVHLDEAAVAIVGEARVVAPGRQSLDGLVVQAQVEDGVHHAGHGELGAGADAHQQRVVDIAELLPHALFQRLEGAEHLIVDLGGNGVVVLEVNIADFRGNGEAGRHRQLGAAHFRETGAFAAEYVFHLSITVGGSVAERVYLLLHA